ncbi:MAG: response regulator [Pyrinomonadaceae bacterium]
MKKLILLVEDNPDDVVLARRALKQIEIENDVIVARDGVEALDFLASQGKFEGRGLRDIPHLILLDIKLPKINGFEVLRSLRSNPETRYVPVVVLTSSTEEKDIAESYDLGANSFVQKPVDFDAFIEETRQLSIYWLAINQTV